MCMFGVSPLIPIITKPPKVIGKAGVLMSVTDILFTPSALCISPANPGYIVLVGSGPCIPVLTWLVSSTSVTILGSPALSVASMAMCNIGKGIIKPIPTNPLPLITK